MNPCCLQALCLRGIITRFKVSPEGERWRCPECGTGYMIYNGKWRREDEPPPPTTTRH